jgi:hypothetical protein
MTLSNEERKEYNKKYYAENKQRIAEMLLTKEECPHCKKLITKGNLRCHMKSSICARRKEKHNQQFNNDLTDLKQQIEALTLKFNLMNGDEKAV